MQLFLHKLCSIANVCKVFKLDKQLIWIGYTNILPNGSCKLYLYNQFIFVVYPIQTTFIFKVTRVTFTGQIFWHKASLKVRFYNWSAKERVDVQHGK